MLVQFFCSTSPKKEASLVIKGNQTTLHKIHHKSNPILVLFRDFPLSFSLSLSFCLTLQPPFPPQTWWVEVGGHCHYVPQVCKQLISQALVSLGMTLLGEEMRGEMQHQSRAGGCHSNLHKPSLFMERLFRDPPLHTHTHTHTHTLHTHTHTSHTRQRALLLLPCLHFCFMFN